MVKTTKSQRLREKMRAEVKHSKQTTLSNLSCMPNTEPAKASVSAQKRQIEITQISTSTREDELVLKICFKVYPSRTAFSKVTSDLYFDEQKIDSLRLRILQGPLAPDDSEFSSVLNMVGIGEGQHVIRVEMYEFWAPDEEPTSTSKEAAIVYVPLKREDRLVRVPIVKSVAGADISTVTNSEKNVYHEIEENMKKESVSSRDNW